MESDKENFVEFLRKRKKTIVLLVSIVFLLLSVIILGLRGRREDTSQLTSTPTTPPLPSPVASTFEFPPRTRRTTKIGKDSFSQTDLEYLAEVHLSGKKLDNLTENEQKKLRDLVLERSVVVQEAAENHLIMFNDDILEPDKDWSDYNRVYERAKEVIIAQEEQISIAGIFIFFYNQFPPEMGVKAAKSLTRSKIETLRQDLVAGNINLKQAAERIRQDTTLSQIDPIWDKNAYAEFLHKNKTRQVVGGIASSDNDLLWELGVGEYSPIILGYETGNAPEPNEAYWAVFQVIEKKGSRKPYLRWLEEAKKKYDVENF